jgi:hypothetical protein
VGTGSTIVDVEGSLSAWDFRVVRPVVLHLVWRGDLVTDLTRPLEGLSPVSPARKALAR